MRHIVGLVGTVGALAVAPVALSSPVAEPTFRLGEFTVTRVESTIGPTTAAMDIRGTINRNLSEASANFVTLRPSFHLQQLCRTPGTSEVPTLATLDTNPTVSSFESTQTGPDTSVSGNRLRWSATIGYDPAVDLSLNVYELPNGDRVTTICNTALEPVGDIAIAGARLSVWPGLGSPPRTPNGTELRVDLELPAGHSVVRL
jgi:hypothetical protein